MEMLISIVRPVIEIGILAVFFYYLLLFIQGTPVIPVLKVLVILFIGFFLAQKFQLHTINWVFTKIFAILVIALLIVFQPELRRALVHLGEIPFFGFATTSKQNIIEEITQAVVNLSRKKIGALITIEREIGLNNYVATGVKIDSIVSRELLMTIFMPATILHDGGVIIQGDRISAAACTLPLSQNPNIEKTMGTRHQAALGITEETDAMVLVVSEETGTISLAYKGKLSRGLDEDAVKKIITGVYTKSKKSV
jgi:diadenylate cyclase